MKMKRWLKIAVAALLVWLLIGHVEWRSVGVILLGVSLPWLFLYIGLQLLGNLISAKKWQYLGNIQGFHFSLKESFFAYLTGAFINNFFPSTIGGDAYRTLWMKKNGDGWQSLAVIIFDRLSGLLALFLLASVGFFTLSWSTWAASPWLLILVGLVLSAAIVTLIGTISAYGIFELVLVIAEWLPWERVARFIRRFELFARGEAYLAALGYALLFTLVGIGLNNFALFTSLGAAVPPLTFFGCIFLATLVSSLPLSINNIGVKEWSYVFFFGLIGVSAELSVAAALLSRLLQMLVSFIALPEYLRSRKIGLENRDV